MRSRGNIGRSRFKKGHSFIRISARDELNGDLYVIGRRLRGFFEMVSAGTKRLVEPSIIA